MNYVEAIVSVVQGNIVKISTGRYLFKANIGFDDCRIDPYWKVNELVGSVVQLDVFNIPSPYLSFDLPWVQDISDVPTNITGCSITTIDDVERELRERIEDTTRLSIYNHGTALIDFYRDIENGVSPEVALKNFNSDRKKESHVIVDSIIDYLRRNNDSSKNESTEHQQ